MTRNKKYIFLSAPFDLEEKAMEVSSNETDRCKFIILQR